MLQTNLPTVLITGATSGFGLATARKFAENGNPLIITGRRLDRLQSLADELEQLVDVFVYPLDVRDSDQVNQLILHLPDRFKHIEVLVNNAVFAANLV